MNHHVILLNSLFTITSTLWHAVCLKKKRTVETNHLRALRFSRREFRAIRSTEITRGSLDKHSAHQNPYAAALASVHHNWHQLSLSQQDGRCVCHTFSGTDLKRRLHKELFSVFLRDICWVADSDECVFFRLQIFVQQLSRPGVERDVQRLLRIRRDPL